MSVVLLAVPSVASAKPSQVDRTNAAKECRAERGATSATQEAFRAAHGTNKNQRNAFGKCVSKRSRAEAAERKSARVNASKQCKAERTELGAEAFAEKYGTNKNKRNAHGKCVSGLAKELEAEEDAEDLQEIRVRKQAAKECKAERTELGAEAFGEKHGTNRNKRNAFGKCVSTTAKADEEEEQPPVTPTA